MVFETVVSGGCRSYVIGCEETRATAIVPLPRECKSGRCRVI